MSTNLNLSLIVKMVDGATAPLRRLNNQIESMQAPVRRFSAEFNRSLQVAGIHRMREGLSGIGREVTGLTLKLTAMAGAMGFVFKSQFIDTAAEFETLKVSLTAVEGSAEKGQKALSWITEFAKKTPLELDTTTKAYMLLKNAGIDPTNGSLLALVDSNSKIGGSQENMIEVTRQLSQAWMKNKLQAEENNVLTERGIKVVPLLAKAMKKSEQAIMDMMGKGKLGRKEIILLLQAMKQDAAGASEAQSRTWSGMMSTLSDTWKGFVNRIMDGGAFEFLKVRLDGLIKKLEFFQTAAGQAQVDQWAGQLKQFLEDIESLASRAWEKISQLAEQVGGFGNLAKIALGVVAAIMAGPLLLAITNVGAALVMLTSTFAANPILLAIGLITAALALWYTNFDDIVSGAKLIWDDLTTWISEKFTGAIKTISSSLQALKDGFMGIFRGLNPFSGNEPLFPLPPQSQITDAPAIQKRPQLGPPVPTLSSSSTRAGFMTPQAKTDVGGTLNIKIDQEGRAKVASMQPNNPGMNFNVDAGLTMMGAC